MIIFKKLYIVNNNNNYCRFPCTKYYYFYTSFIDKVLHKMSLINLKKGLQISPKFCQFTHCHLSPKSIYLQKCGGGEAIAVAPCPPPPDYAPAYQRAKRLVMLFRNLVDTRPYTIGFKQLNTKKLFIFLRAFFVFSR